jgi:hypothetical protein
MRYKMYRNIIGLDFKGDLRSLISRRQTKGRLIGRLNELSVGLTPFVDRPKADLSVVGAADL